MVVASPKRGAATKPTIVMIIAMNRLLMGRCVRRPKAVLIPTFSVQGVRCVSIVYTDVTGKKIVARTTIPTSSTATRGLVVPTNSDAITACVYRSLSIAIRPTTVVTAVTRGTAMRMRATQVGSSVSKVDIASGMHTNVTMLRTVWTDPTKLLVLRGRKTNFAKLDRTS